MEITALLVSLLALGFSIYSVVETHRTNRLTNRPAIVGHETKGWDEYKYELVNKGTGPAYLKEVEWFWNKEPIIGRSIDEVVAEKIRAYGLPPTQMVTVLGKNTIIGIGERLVLGSLSLKPEHIPLFQEMEKEGFGVRISYESAHGEKFMFHSDDELKNI